MAPGACWRRAVALLLVLAQVACRAEAPDGRPLVITTVLPITLFSRAVAGDCARVQPLIADGASAHAMQARPGDLIPLRQARLLVKNGLGLEPFLDPLLRAAGNRDLRVIDASRGLAPLPLAQDGHGHRGVNPHVWLDPRRVEHQVATIRDGLIEADPRCAAGYRRRAQQLITELRQLDRDLARQLAPDRGRTFVALHAVAPYFAQRYGLRATNLVDLPVQDPTPADLQRVAALVRRHRLKALLSEPRQNNRALQALAADLGLELREFDPLESAADPRAGVALYGQVMRRNANAVAGVWRRP